MKNDIHQVLKEYWGYTSFRPLQEEIILSVLAKRDTLALMPTGGGKSICFQLPVMARPGIGIVVSPLIALMNDQVANLQKLGIKAVALTSALSHREVDLALENCVNGHYKFLYLSPERLQSELVRERIKRMKVNLLAVDEAHCISQWGYDFRPPYTQIAEVREIMPEVSLLALTATATPRVVDDICEKLHFRETNLLKQSFYRPNLFYNVTHTEAKWSKTLEILKKINGSGIVYVRNRKHTVEIANWLRQNRFSADFYHAGLSSGEREQKQDDWLQNRSRIMVCTNAFGMGIDKPDVKIVLHLDLPDSLEAYFQEAGRAGRQGQKSYSVILAGPSDTKELKARYLDSFPDLAFVRRLYQALGNHLQLAVGMGEGQSFDFDLKEFCSKYDLPLMTSFQALSILEKEGLLSFSEGYHQSSRLLIKMDRTTLYDFQLRNPKIDPLIKVLVRSYGGLEIEYTRISEGLLAKRLKSSADTIKKVLLHLHKQGVVDYIPSHGDSQISFSQPRLKAEFLNISALHLKERYEDRRRRVQAVIDFLENNKECRSIALLRYFGEKSKHRCGYCDVCRAQKGSDLSDEEWQRLSENIQQFLAENDAQTILAIKDQFAHRHLQSVLRWLIDEGNITENNGLYSKPK